MTDGAAGEVRRARGAAELLRQVGLLSDGPVRWGAPVRSARPGVFLVEMAAPLPRAPIDISRIGTWIDRVPTLRLDGERPTGKDLAARLSAFWLPDQVVLYIGSTPDSIGRRVAELESTPLGEPAVGEDGRWLGALRGLEQARVWWADTDAPEEYADAILGAFAEGVAPASAEALHDPTVVVPFANTSTPSGLQREHGITGDAMAAPPPAPAPRRVVTLPPGNAVSSEQSMAPRGRATGGASRTRVSGGTPSGGGAAGIGPTGRAVSRTAASRTAVPTSSAARPSAPARGRSPASTTAGSSASRSAPGARRVSAKAIANAAPPPGRQPEAVHVTADGLAQLQQELDELVGVRRPEIIARVRAARELGDLSENADYEAARKEQSFAEGRIAQLEAMIRNASIIEAPSGGSHVELGSTVVVESAEGEETFTIVGSSEARPSEGRISNTSPLGQALLGHRPGDDVVVRAPAGDRHFTIRELR